MYSSQGMRPTAERGGRCSPPLPPKLEGVGPICGSGWMHGKACTLTMQRGGAPLKEDGVGLQVWREMLGKACIPHRGCTPTTGESLPQSSEGNAP